MDCFCVVSEWYQPYSIIRKLKLRKVGKSVQDYTTKKWGEGEISNKTFLSLSESTSLLITV